MRLQVFEVKATGFLFPRVVNPSSHGALHSSIKHVKKDDCDILRTELPCESQKVEANHGMF